MKKIFFRRNYNIKISEIEDIISDIKAKNIYFEPKEETINKIASYASEYIRTERIKNGVSKSYFNLSSIIDFVKSRYNINFKRGFVPAALCIIISIITIILFYKNNYLPQKLTNYNTSLFPKNAIKTRAESPKFLSESVLNRKIENLINDIEIAHLDSIVQILFELESNKTSLEIYDLIENIKEGGEIL